MGDIPLIRAVVDEKGLAEIVHVLMDEDALKLLIDPFGGTGGASDMLLEILAQQAVDEVDREEGILRAAEDMGADGEMVCLGEVLLYGDAVFELLIGADELEAGEAVAELFEQE